jgi:hypothetical protein
MPMEPGFPAGYLLYTGLLPVPGLLVPVVAGTGTTALAAPFAVRQLAILRLRAGVRSGFHAGCALVTLGNLMVVPLLLAGAAHRLMQARAPSVRSSGRLKTVTLDCK